MSYFVFVFFFSSRRRHTRWTGDWSSDVCSSDLHGPDPRQQFVVVKRPRNVVVAAAVEGTDAVDRVGLRAAEHDHGHFAIPGATRLTLAQPAAELRGRKDE